MSKKRLLVIEDDVDVAEMLIVYFTAQGFDVISAMNGNDGIALARAKFPNLILLDVMLPDMDGFDVCKVLRTTALTKYIPTIFLTQRDARADKVIGLELGADDYVTKPFDVEELRLRVQGSLRRSSREALQDPRTGLPTSALIEDMRESLSKKQGYAQLNVTLVGFNHFRDKYGFVTADEVLAFTGQMLTETLSKQGTPDDFVGTMDQEHFVIFTFSPNVDELIQSLTDKFKEGASKFYNFVDNEQGYLVVNDLTDFEQHVPLMHFVITGTSVAEKAQAGQ